MIALDHVTDTRSSDSLSAHLVGSRNGPGPEATRNLPGRDRSLPTRTPIAHGSCRSTRSSSTSPRCGRTSRCRPAPRRSRRTTHTTVPEPSAHDTHDLPWMRGGYFSTPSPRAGRDPRRPSPWDLPDMYLKSPVVISAARPAAALASPTAAVRAAAPWAWDRSCTRRACTRRGGASHGSASARRCIPRDARPKPAC